MTKPSALKQDVAAYWNEHIHDLKIASGTIGSAEFFRSLAAYRYEKLDYLPSVVDFGGYAGREVLEIGCGVGLDLLRFARGGAAVTGVDLSRTAVDLARSYFSQNGLSADLQVMDGEALSYQDNRFDLVYAHGVLQYTVDPARMMAEIARVLKPGGQAILMVYNRLSWLNALSTLMKVELEHEDAPVLRKLSRTEFRQLLTPLAEVEILPERFPVHSRLHTGVKGWAFNYLFVGSFNLLPRRLVRPLGWHLMGYGRKRPD